MLCLTTGLKLLSCLSLSSCAILHQSLKLSGPFLSSSKKDGVGGGGSFEGFEDSVSLDHCKEREGKQAPKKAGERWDHNLCVVGRCVCMCQSLCVIQGL